MPPQTPLLERFMEKVTPEPNSGCWLWIASLTNGGYGQIGVGSLLDGTRSMAGAHRVSYCLFKGEIPDGMVIRHKCHVRCCVNPDHLMIGTPADNLNDTIKYRGHHYSNRTHCKNGHEFPELSKIDRSGGRICKQCQREKWLNSNERRDGLRRQAIMRARALSAAADPRPVTVIAQDIGVSFQTVYRWKNGQIPYANLQTTQPKENPNGT